MRILLLGHGWGLSEVPRNLPCLSEDWALFVDGHEVIMADVEAYYRPDIVCDLSKPWPRLSSPVSVIVDAMGHVCSPLVQTPAFWSSAAAALASGGRMYLWRSRGVACMYRKDGERLVLQKVLDFPKIVRRRIHMWEYENAKDIGAMWEVHEVRIPKLTPPIRSVVERLPHMEIEVWNEKQRMFSIGCDRELNAPPSGEYRWSLRAVHPDVRRIEIVDGCDNGTYDLRTTHLNGIFSFEHPKKIWDASSGESPPFYGHMNSFVTLRIHVPATVIWSWEAIYTGGCRIALEQMRSPVKEKAEDQHPGLEIVMQTEQEERADRLEAELVAQTERADRLEAELASQTERADRLEAELVAQTERADRLEAELAAQTERADRLEAELAAQTERADRLESELAAQTERADRLEAELAAQTVRAEEQGRMFRKELAELRDLLQRFGMQR